MTDELVTGATDVAAAKAPAKPAKAPAKPAKAAPVAAPKRGRPKGSKNRSKQTAAPEIVSVGELEKQLAKQEKSLTKLQARKRKELLKRLAQVNSALASLQGTVRVKTARKAAAKVAKGGRRANGQTLPDCIAKVLKRRKNGMTVKDLVGAVGRAGYKSSAKNLYPMISAALRNDRFQKISRGTYAIK